MFDNSRENFRFIKPYWRKGVVPILFLLISTIASFIYPLFPKWAIDNVVIKGKYDQLIVLSGFLLLLIIIQWIFAYLNEVTFFKFQKSSILSIQEKLLRKVFYYPLDFFDKNHSGYLVGRIRGDVSGLSYIFSSGLVMLFMDLIKFIGAFIILLTINVKLTLISFSIFPFLIWKISSSRNSIKQVNEKILEENAILERELSDTLQGIEVFKSFSKEEEGIERSVKALSEYQSVELERNKVSVRYKNLIGFIINIGQVALLYFGIIEIITNQMSIGGYVAFSGYLIYLYSPIQNLGHVMVIYDYAKRSYFRIKELFDLLPENNGDNIIDKINRIKVAGLSFSYSNGDAVINELDFDIKKGDKVLISGKSGTGKSTLVKLLLGLYRPKKGNIFYNDINLNKLNLNNLREKVGYVSQNIFLFNQSLRENIVMGNKDVLDSELAGIIKDCKLEIRKKAGSVLKGKDILDLDISEKGLNLSGGEKQRIALCRAIIKDPDIIILDEGTSNLDIKSEEEILDIIEKKFNDRIIIRITHRKNMSEKGWKIISM